MVATMVLTNATDRSTMKPVHCLFVPYAGIEPTAVRMNIASHQFSGTFTPHATETAQKTQLQYRGHGGIENWQPTCNKLVLIFKQLC